MVVLVSGPFLGRVGLAEVASALVIAALVDLKCVAADFRLKVVKGDMSAGVVLFGFGLHIPFDVHWFVSLQGTGELEPAGQYEPTGQRTGVTDLAGQ